MYAAELTLYHTPEDAAVGQAALLAATATAVEAWVGMYAFSWLPFVTALVGRDAAGYPAWVLADASQAQQPGARKAMALLATIQHGSFTRSTAGPRSPHAILHDKVVILAQPDGTDVVWTGSLNLTALGWREANTVTTWQERQGWARQVYLPWWVATQAWAVTHVPQHPALRAAPPGPSLLGQEREV